MDVLDAIKERRSIRSFKSEKVSRELIEELLSLTINAPSANNLQPWEFIVVSGEEKERLSRTLIKGYKEKQISCGSGAVKPLPEVFRKRGVANTEMMREYVEKTGVSIEDFVNEGSCNFYGASTAILMCLDDCFSKNQLIDTGTAISYLALAAHALGFSTCPVGLIVSYEEEVRELLNIPENKQLVMGIAVGYPDPENPVTQYKSERDSLAEMVRWI